MEVSKKYKEIFKLKKMLEDENIEHEFIDRSITGTRYNSEKYQICCPNCGEDRYISIIEGDISYGSEEDKLEIQGLMTDEEYEYDAVVGHLSAENVLERIKNHLKGE